tara:strand:+ start:38316 stop:38528 length:213 start_codon:yes stop_codon:yes gene_type:complete
MSQQNNSQPLQDGINRLNQIRQEISTGNISIDKVEGLIKEADEIYKSINKPLEDLANFINEKQKNSQQQN